MPTLWCSKPNLWGSTPELWGSKLNFWDSKPNSGGPKTPFLGTEATFWTLKPNSGFKTHYFWKPKATFWRSKPPLKAKARLPGTWACLVGFGLKHWVFGQVLYQLRLLWAGHGPAGLRGGHLPEPTGVCGGGHPGQAGLRPDHQRCRAPGGPGGFLGAGGGLHPRQHHRAHGWAPGRTRGGRRDGWRARGWRARWWNGEMEDGGGTVGGVGRKIGGTCRGGGLGGW